MVLPETLRLRGGTRKTYVFLREWSVVALRCGQELSVEPSKLAQDQADSLHAQPERCMTQS